MNKLTVAVAVLSLGSFAFAQGRDDFMRQQAVAEMQRVSGQIDVLQNNFDDLQRRVGRLEGGTDTRQLSAEIDALKASIAELRREMSNMRSEVVKDISARIAKMQPVAAPERPAPPAKKVVAGPCKEYVVEKGDTLFVIASAFNTTVAKLREMNNLKGDTLRVGQKLMVPMEK